MTREEVIQQLTTKPRLIRWMKSNIVEAIRLTKDNQLLVTNVISKKSYLIPKRYNELNISFVEDTHIKLGDLISKRSKLNA